MVELKMTKAFLMKFWLMLGLVSLLARSSFAQCALTNIGKTPLPEMGLTLYGGYSGGLYPGGANNRPPAHLAAGLRIATDDIQPLDAHGTNSSSGKIVMISVGM